MTDPSRDKPPTPAGDSDPFRIERQLMHAHADLTAIDPNRCTAEVSDADRAVLPAIKALTLATNSGAPVEQLIATLGEALRGVEVPVERLTFHLRTLHPEFTGFGVVWRHGSDSVLQRQASHQIVTTASFQNSPLAKLYSRAQPEVRARLDAPDAALEYDLFVEMKRAGMTEYYLMPLVLSDGSLHGASFATSQPGGFTEDQVQRIKAVLGTLTMALEARANRRVAENIVDVYLGRAAGQRVLAGQIRRGDVTTMRAIVVYADMRGFTKLTHGIAPDRVIETLNHYFSRIVGPIQARGGETLKFMGDGLLAIFELNDAAPDSREGRARARTALEAVREARARTRELNDARLFEGLAPVRFGVSLDAGEVSYGNIGASTRLDFTVIGPVVNRASRLEALAAKLPGEFQVVMSADFQSYAQVPAKSLGAHALKGVDDPVEVFVPLDPWAAGRDTDTRFTSAND